jgi:hypothetical protein
MEYRIWDKDQKKYIKDAVITQDGAIQILRGNEKLNEIINRHYLDEGDILGGDYTVIDYTDWYGINSCVTEKCVGCLDKNGKKIYENDIILTDEAGWCGFVVFEHGSFTIIDDKGGYAWMPSWERCEVIGNRNSNLSE